MEDEDIQIYGMVGLRLARRDGFERLPSNAERKTCIAVKLVGPSGRT